MTKAHRLYAPNPEAPARKFKLVDLAGNPVHLPVLRQTDITRAEHWIAEFKPSPFEGGAGLVRTSLGEVFHPAAFGLRIVEVL